jgi:hypothetical protein
MRYSIDKHSNHNMLQLRMRIMIAAVAKAIVEEQSSQSNPDVTYAKQKGVHATHTAPRLCTLCLLVSPIVPLSPGIRHQERLYTHNKDLPYSQIPTSPQAPSPVGPEPTEPPMSQKFRLEPLLRLRFVLWLAQLSLLVLTPSLDFTSGTIGWC